MTREESAPKGVPVPRRMKKACMYRLAHAGSILFLIFHKGSQIAHRADPLQVVIRPFDAEFLLQGKHHVTKPLNYASSSAQHCNR